MKTVLAIQILLVSFKLITAPETEETSNRNDDDNVPDEIKCNELKNLTTQQDPVDITIIDEFEEKIKNINDISISKEDAEFIKDVKLKYWLFDSPSVEVEFGNENILESSWMVGKPLKIIVHGWSFIRPGEPKALCIKDAYINSQEYNVITVDWSTLASSKYYFKVTRLSAQVGIILGHFLIDLVKIGFLSPSDIHVIGHSIGAHVAAKSGDVFLHIMNVKLDRITGLDPASPGFKDSMSCLWRPSECLDKDDATFVDVVHTASGVQGISQPIGHVDFYPNNGKSPQPGCERFNPFEKLHCSHSRAYIYYMESINNSSSFESWKCKSMKKFNNRKCIKNVKNYMGHYANRNDEGKFFLRTNNRSPYSIYFN